MDEWIQDNDLGGVSAIGELIAAVIYSAALIASELGLNELSKYQAFSFI